MWLGGIGFCAVLLALALATGVVVNGMSPFLIRRKTDPGPYWLGVFWIVLALVIVTVLGVANGFKE